MRIQTIIDMANEVHDLNDCVNNISAGVEHPRVLLHSDAFFDTFQTYEEEQRENCKIYTAVLCNVEFSTVVM